MQAKRQSTSQHNSNNDSQIQQSSNGGAVNLNHARIVSTGSANKKQDVFTRQPQTFI